MKPRSHEEAEAARAQAHTEFGDRLYELCSDNVNPGWEAIFIEPCQEPYTCNIKRRYGLVPFEKAYSMVAIWLAASSPRVFYSLVL